MKQKQIIFNVSMSVLLMLCLGIVYSYSLFRLEIESIYQTTKTLSGLPFMLVLLFYSLSMAISGILYDKYKSIYVSIVGVCLISLGFYFSSIAHNIWLISFFYGVFIGTGIGILYTLPLRVMSHINHKNNGFLTGIILLGFGISPLLSAPIIERLLVQYGLSKTFFILSILYLILLSLTIIPLVAQDKKPLVKQKISFNVLKDIRFYYIYILFFIATFIGLSIIGMTSTIGVNLLNISISNIALLLGLFSIFNGIGRPLFGYINDKRSFKFSAIISYISILIVSLLSFILFNNIYIFIISFIIFYLNLGGWLSLAPSATLKTFGKEKYSQTYGFLFTAYGLGAFIGNGTSSYLIDHFTYQSIYLLIFFISAIGLFITLYIKRKASN
jgi:MFS family permease